MKGYEGVESLVYRALSRIMEQVEGGDLVVNRGNEPKPNASAERDIGAIDGIDAALKLAVADLEQLVQSEKVKAAEAKATNVDKKNNPTTSSFVFLRIQPFFSTLFTIPPPAASSPDGTTQTSPPQQLQFLLHLTDPQHSISHVTVTQTVPATWLEIWDDYEWVEDLVVDALRIGVEIIGEEYLVSRMNWGKRSSSSEAESTAVEKQPHAEQQDGEKASKLDG